MFDDSMQSNLAWRMDVEHALHRAIERHELQLYHQPILDLRDRSPERIRGADPRGNETV